jgi:uncharacterized protein
MPKSECPVKISGLASREDLAKWSQVDKNPSVPFVHRFQTKRFKYVYDVNTSRILEVAPVIWDIIGDFGNLSKSEIIAKHSSEYNVNEVSSAYEVILKMQKKHGLLLANRPKHITMPYDEAGIHKELKSQRKILILGVTEACNFRCLYCVFSGKYRVRRHHSTRMMNWDIARLAISDFLSHGGSSGNRVISFYGGEPLLNIKLIRKCVAYTHQKIGKGDMIFSLNTNGSLLAGETADFLASEKFAIVVSLDGPKQIHDRNRRFKNGSPTWKQVVTNIKTFLQEHPEYNTNGLMGVNVVVTPPINMTELEQFFNRCNFFTEGINLMLGWVFGHDSTYVEDLSPEDRRIEGLDELYEKFIVNLENGTVNKKPDAVQLKLQEAVFQRSFLNLHKRGLSTPKFPLIPDHFCPLPTCVPGGPRLFVAADGTYYTCDRSPETDFMNIGNVHEGINVSKVRQILDGFVDLGKDECRFCWCLPTCSAGCVLTVMENGKLSKKARREACAAYRKTTNRTLRSICRILEKNPHALDYMEKINPF